jgi:hypothetical protein
MIIAVAGIDDTGRVQLGDPDPPGSTTPATVFPCQWSAFQKIRGARQIDHHTEEFVNATRMGVAEWVCTVREECEARAMVSLVAPLFALHPTKLRKLNRIADCAVKAGALGFKAVRGRPALQKHAAKNS